MFGLEILDVVIGLTFVYLLLSLLATALNEYVSSILNLRGRELARGLGRLLDDLDEKGAVQKALDGVGKKLTTQSALLTEQLYNHRLIRPYATRRGRFGRFFLKIRRLDEKPRLPSYMPARTFALALLDILGVDDKSAKQDPLFAAPEGKTLAEAAAEAEKNALTAEATAKSANTKEALQAAADARLIATKAKLAQVLTILRQQSSRDLTEHLGTLGTLPQADKLAGALQVQVAGLLADSQTQLQKLHDGVEIWFNNSMDRVSGAYKRNIQGWLFAIGLLIALWMNADTIQMWRSLATNDKLRDAMAERAGLMLPELEPRVDSLRRVAAAATQSQDSIRVASGGGAQTPLPVAGAISASNTTTPAGAGATTDSVRVSVADSLRRDSIAWARFERTKAYLDSMELKLGWTTEEAVRARLLRKDSAKVYPQEGTGVPKRILTSLEKRFAPKGYHADLFPFDTGSAWSKLLGLLLTAIAISLGAPFWFDMLNKVISIRGAGRSPEEKPKSPQAPAKRAGEERPK